MMMVISLTVLALGFLLSVSSEELGNTSLTLTEDNTENNETFCQRIMLPMCRGQMPYQYTRLPVTVLEKTYRNQAEIAERLELIWPFLDLNCSPNLRLAACGMYLPKCTEGTQKVMKPCRGVCVKARRSCRDTFQNYHREWTLPCSALPRPKRGRKKGCLSQITRRTVTRIEESRCETIQVPMCQGLAYNNTFMPNVFLMAGQTEIQTELESYRELLDTQCSPHLEFFLCGIYLPFCIDVATPFAVPCRFVCQEVRDACWVDFQMIYGIEWVSKLQCHRYPERGDTTWGPCMLASDSMDTLTEAVSRSRDHG